MVTPRRNSGSGIKVSVRVVTVECIAMEIDALLVWLHRSP